MQLPPPPGQESPWSRGPRLLTPGTGSVGALTAYLMAVYFAYLALRPFPSARGLITMVVIAPLAAAGGAWAGAIEPADGRLRAAIVVLVLTFGVPFALAAWIPGIAQEQQHALPGGGDLVIAAAPDRNLDLYLIPDGDPERTIELTNTPVQRERFPTLSPDGRSIVYAADAADGSTDLYLLPIDESGRPGRSRLLLDAGRSVGDELVARRRDDPRPIRS